MASPRKFICLLVTILAAWNVAAQQITGSIRGMVIDPTGAIVRNASVSAKQTETGLVRTCHDR